MPLVGAYPRKAGNKTILIEKHLRMPRRRPNLHPEDKELWELERQMVELQKELEKLKSTAEKYWELHLPELAERKSEQIKEYKARIKELADKIKKLKKDSILEGVQE